MASREFTAEQEYPYARSNARRWLLSHLGRYRFYILLYLIGSVSWHVLTSAIPWITGRGFDAVLQDSPDLHGFLLVVLILLAVVLGRGLLGIGKTYSLENVANSLERDVRDELYINLLGKSQTFFDRQRVGNLMARATDDTNQVNEMFAPGWDIILDLVVGIVVPIVFIGLIRPELLLSPVLFVLLFAVALLDYSHRLAPISTHMREQFGVMKAHLAEAISGIELIESAGQKAQERYRFEQNARRYRDLFIRQGWIQALYIPPLLLTIAVIGAFLHGLLLVARGHLTVGDLVAYLGLMAMLRSPTRLASFSLVLIHLGLASTKRILALLNDETTLNDNPAGHKGEIKGDVVFERVAFGYDVTPVLENISFRVRPGETIALVGPTGSGKSTLTKLLNRTYDVDAGGILVDGVDLREWNVESLRSQISVIEQDVVLFSRSIAENIAFGRGPKADSRQIEWAACEAQAHDFITGLKEGYETVIGERGVTLSGGQRQRLAIARALLTDPRILILDDSTSAVDSATEEKIQKAIRRVSASRTTFLITHRLSQIKSADKILVLDQGRLVDQGTHDELLRRCALYRRIFAPYYVRSPASAAEARTTSADYPGSADQTSGARVLREGESWRTYWEV